MFEKYLQRLSPDSRPYLQVQTISQPSGLRSEMLRICQNHWVLGVNGCVIVRSQCVPHSTMEVQAKVNGNKENENVQSRLPGIRWISVLCLFCTFV